jgi:secreted PhoX family phosphatase
MQHGSNAPTPRASNDNHSADLTLAATCDNGPTMGDIVAARFGRRDLMKGLLAATALSAIAGPLSLATRRAEAAASSFTFGEIAHGVDETHHVAPGYAADILIRWGDPVLADAPPFDPLKQSAQAQAKQFGYNNDYIGYVPLPIGSNTADHGLLCINHEYTNADHMFPGVTDPMTDLTKPLVDVEMAAHGASVIEIQKQNGKWQVVKGSRYARRLTSETPIRISGPAAGHARMKTSYDPAGTQVRGMVNNCAGGITAWGSYLTCEENFNNYFVGEIAGHAEEANYKSYGVPGKEYAWGKFHDRFDIGKEPNEANRFGWVVEIDPLDPTAVPVKRTALGRFKHEGAESLVNKDGRVVLYSGDDERFAFLYRFVTAGRFNPSDRAANRDLFDDGMLYAAKFAADGKLEWLPLTYGSGPLTEANDFRSQADVLIEARKAARLLGATQMDRPEDVEPVKGGDKIYMALTNNDRRKPEQVDAVNPRPLNQWGHIVEMTAPDSDHTATTYSWEILVKCGDPAVADIGAMWNPATTENGWFACPDNVAMDHQGRLWVATDQGAAWNKASGTADGIFALDTKGAARGTSRMFFRVPAGAEMCGPLFTPDDRTMFCAVQHPSVDGVEAWDKFGRKSSFADTATRWPDFKPDMPVRPSVIVITKQDGGVIGS